MPSIMKRISLPSSETGSYYPLQGSQYEYLPWDARLEFAVVTSGTIADGEDVKMNIFSGSDILVQNGAVGTITSGHLPVYPDDFLISDVAAAGERISVEIVYTTGASTAIEVTSVARLTPV